MSKETGFRIEPSKIEQAPGRLVDLVAELSASTAILGSRLHPKTAAQLADLVRVMNTYYSNLIEGHDTRPREIERALAGDWEEDQGRRSLQLEAMAHIRVQTSIDRMAHEGTLLEPASCQFIRWLHEEFYRDAPEEALWIQGGKSRYLMAPGEWRSQPDQDVSVGRHIPPSSERVESFMNYFESRYRFEGLGRATQVLMAAAAHHRFNFIHPFPDGNGRVSRLMTHAMMHQARVSAHGLWSISRGLARGLKSRTDYKTMMDHADSPRQGALDGRGNLSQKALIEFTQWFIEVCLDQVEFMSGLFELNRLSERLRSYVARHPRLKDESAFLLEEALLRGEFDRGEASRITGLPERSARRVLSHLLEEGVLSSETKKSPVSLRFPVETLEDLFPKLYPVI
jgi:Fic family protein